MSSVLFYAQCRFDEYDTNISFGIIVLQRAIGFLVLNALFLTQNRYRVINKRSANIAKLELGAPFRSIFLYGQESSYQSGHQPGHDRSVRSYDFSLIQFFIYQNSRSELTSYFLFYRVSSLTCDKKFWKDVDMWNVICNSEVKRIQWQWKQVQKSKEPIIAIYVCLCAWFLWFLSDLQNLNFKNSSRAKHITSLFSFLFTLLVF